MKNDEWKEKLRLYDQLVATHPSLERKGKTMPYTSVNGHMFSMLNKDGEIGVRLSDEAGERFIKDHQTTRFKSHGAFMRGYVVVPEALCEDMDKLAALLQEAYEYALSLEPK